MSDSFASVLVQDEVISYVRRRSNAFSRGKSQYRGVSGREGRWETRIGTFAGLKNVSSVWTDISMRFHLEEFGSVLRRCHSFPVLCMMHTILCGECC